MSGAVTAVAIGTAAVAASSIYSANKQAEAQKSAQRSAEAQAQKQQQQAESEFNRANQKAPDLAGIIASNKRAEGAGGTMLTGPQGVDTGSLSLGKNTLLGG